MKHAAVIFFLSAAPASAQVCMSKTSEEVMQDVRAKAGCPNAKPTDCPCSGNLQQQYDCPLPSVTLWNSTGKKCIKADSDKDSTWAKHAGKWDYPARTGKDCSEVNIEPGSYDCTKVLIAGSNPKKYATHEFKNPSAGYNGKYDSAAWCTQKSCYVDPCKCNLKDMQSSSWFKKPDGSPMYYSGLKCGGPFEFKAALCKGKTSKDACGKDAGCKWSPKPVCRSKTEDETMKELRTKLKCPDAKPTDCNCTGNLQTQYDCPAPNKTLWTSTGKKCIKADSDKDATWAKHTGKWDYPAETGKDCSKVNIEPGSYDCTKVLIAGSNPKKYVTHEFKNPSAGYNSKYDSEAWCTQKSCYVDPCKCNMRDMSSSSWFKKPDGSTMYYSGMKCGAPFEFKAALCQGKTTMNTCNVDTGCLWEAGGVATAKATCANFTCPTDLMANSANSKSECSGDKSTCKSTTCCKAKAPPKVCRSKTEAETMKELRTKLKCPDAKPTDCNCTGNLQTQYDCPLPSVTLWNSTGKKCIKADSDKDSTWAKHAGKWDYPARTGKDCTQINIEPGSYDCTKVLIADSNPKKYVTHEFKNPSAGYNSKYDSEPWCTQKSCYVDPCKCNMRDMSSSSWFKKADGSAMYYSGMKCGAPFEFKAALCAGKSTMDTCNVDKGCMWDVAKAPSAAAPIPQQVVKGSVNFEVTLPANVTKAQFLEDPKVKTGVQKGIATKLGVSHTWVTVTLTAARRLSASRLLAGAKANVKVDFTVTVPAGTTGATSATTLKKALTGADSNSAAEKVAWAKNVVKEIKAASPTTYANIVVETKNVAHVPTTTAPPAGAPNTSGADATSGVEMYLVMIAIGFANMAA